jgi:hypothetical protein
VVDRVRAPELYAVKVKEPEGVREGSSVADTAGEGVAVRDARADGEVEIEAEGVAVKEVLIVEVPTGLKEAEESQVALSENVDCAETDMDELPETLTVCVNDAFEDAVIALLDD